MGAGYLCGLVGFGVGGPPRPGLVRVGVGVDDGPVGVVAAVRSGVPAGRVPGTTSTTGAEVALTCGVGAAVTGVAEAGPEVVAPLGRGSPCGLPPTAQAMPAEPTSAATPSTNDDAVAAWSAVPTHRSSLPQECPAPPSWQHGRVSEQQKQADNRARATTDEFRAFVREGWAPRRSEVSGPAPGAAPAAARRTVLSAAYPGQRLVVPAGGLKVRTNDTDYVFRPHTAFAWLTGLGADREPDAVLVLEPVSGRRRRRRPRGGALLPPAGRP